MESDSFGRVGRWHRRIHMSRLIRRRSDVDNHKTIQFNRSEWVLIFIFHTHLWPPHASVVRYDEVFPIVFWWEKQEISTQLDFIWSIKIAHWILRVLTRSSHWEYFTERRDIVSATGRLSIVLFVHLHSSNHSTRVFSVSCSTVDQWE